MTAFRPAIPPTILAELDALRAGDAPTHGGRVLSYVYDSGLAELDELAAAAIARSCSPSTGSTRPRSRSVAAMERELVGFARADARTASDDGRRASVTSRRHRELPARGEDRARRLARGRGTGTPRVPRLVAPVTVHAAFHKAADYFGLVLDLVPVDAGTGAVAAARLDRRGSATTSRSSWCQRAVYPHATLDPVADVAAAAAARASRCHVDACIGGFVLPFWPERRCRPGTSACPA